MEIFRNDKTGAKKITIADVAEALQVSKTTVSRAISGKGRISEDTRKKVLEYIEKNDYKPNVIAKGLAQQKTYNIALVIPGDCNLVDMPFFQNSMQGVCEEASRHDYDVMLVTMAGNHSHNLERMIANHKVDGVILSRSFVKDRAAEFLQEQEIPFILMGTSKNEAILQVDNDHKSACSELVTGILEKGIHRIGLIGGSRNYVVNRTRLQGYKEAFRNAKLSLEENLMYDDCETAVKVEQAVKNLIGRNTQCIICMDDMICSQVLTVLSREHVKVPEQMKVASFYDSTLLLNNDPAITSLLFDAKALGSLTCSVLLDYIQGKEVKGKTLLGYEIAYRKSTGIGGMED